MTCRINSSPGRRKFWKRILPTLLTGSYWTRRCTLWATGRKKTRFFVVGWCGALNGC